MNAEFMKILLFYFEIIELSAAALRYPLKLWYCAKIRFFFLESF